MTREGLTNPTKGATERIGCSLCFIRIITMTNKETIDRWAEQIIPAVFRAEDALQKAKPEWNERLKNVTPENGHELAEEYCREIATIIVTQGADYVPDGTIEDE